MPKRTGNTTRNTLVSAPLPEATDTYTVISHGSIINHTLRALTEKGFQIVDEIYKCSANAQIAMGIFRIKYALDADMSMMFAFVNSYNKALRFKCVVGGYLYASESFIISGNMMSWSRKHTGTADDEVVDMIEKQVDNAEKYFAQLVQDKEAMKEVILNKTQFAELLGVLYLEDELLTGEQMSIIKAEYYKPSRVYAEDPHSLWVLYNHILMALKKSHPRTWMDQQKLVHYKLLTTFNLSTFDDDQTVDDDDDTPPNMTSESGYTTEASPVAYNNYPDPTDLVDVTFDQEAPVVNPDQLDLAKQAEAVEEFGVSNISELTPEQEKEVTVKAKPILPGYQIGKTTIGERNEAGEVLESGHTRIIDFGNEEHLRQIQYPVSMEDCFENSDGIAPALEVEEVEAPVATTSTECVEIFMSRMDLLSIDTDAVVDGVILLMDEPYIIIRAGEQNGVDGFFLCKIEDEEEVTAETPVQPTAIPENAIRMQLEDLLLVSNVALQIGNQINIEGYDLEIYSILDNEVILIPYVPWKTDDEVRLPVEPADYDFSKTVQYMDQEEDDDWEKFGAKEIPYVAPQEPAKYIAGIDPISEDAPVEINPVNTEAEVHILENAELAVGDPTTEDDTEYEEEPSDEKLLAEKQQDAIRDVISQELFDLYGTIPEYNFTLEDGQYNVVLSTGEVVVLLQPEIDKRVSVL